MNGKKHYLEGHVLLCVMMLRAPESIFRFNDFLEGLTVCMRGSN